MTLYNLSTETYIVRSPMMTAAVNNAIAQHGPHALCTTASGTVTHRNGSNAAKAAKSINASNYAIYAGPRAGRYATEGYHMVIVAL
jgi:hypothetical protein